MAKYLFVYHGGGDNPESEEETHLFASIKGKNGSINSVFLENILLMIFLKN